MRAIAPTDIHHGDQTKQADYIFDIVNNNNWLVQHHAISSQITAMTKPPLYNWLAASLVLLTGKSNDFILKFPSIIAGLLALFLFWDITRKFFNARISLLASLFLATTLMFIKHSYYLRTDMLLTLLIMAQIWSMIYWLEDKKTRWLACFWLAGGLGMLVKGPIALLFPHITFTLLWLVEQRWWRNYHRIITHWSILLLLLPGTTWLLMVYIVEGSGAIFNLYQNFIINETIDRFNLNNPESRGIFYYIPLFTIRAIPWSILTFIALYLIPWCSLRNNWVQYRGIIFALCWFLGTVIFMSFIPSKRGDRILASLPAAMILAAWAFEYLTHNNRYKNVILSSLLVATITVIGIEKNYPRSEHAEVRYAESVLNELAAYQAQYGDGEIIILDGYYYAGNLRYILEDLIPSTEPHDVQLRSDTHTYIIGNRHTILKLASGYFLSDFFIPIKDTVDPLDRVNLIVELTGGYYLGDFSIPTGNISYPLAVLHYLPTESEGGYHDG